MSIEKCCSNSIRDKLLYEIKEGVFSDCSKLPREIELSEKLGISRTHLRDVLPSLEREGFITRIHGSGTYINRHVLEVKNRMDIEIEFLDIIKQSGYEAAYSFIDVSECRADEKVADKLKIEVDMPVIRICLMCTANGKPAIYAEDYIDKRRLKADYEKEEHNYNVFEFLKKFCNDEAYMDLTELHPVIADERLAKLFEIFIGTPLLNMEEVDYNIKGMPIFYSRQYFADGYANHTVLRKRL
ncbi:MAG: GntR family transcriptional regulator [Firmicutes bacterium]|nr:GntR family transcriptional regulator [Bacillota bacterium]